MNEKTAYLQKRGDVLVESGSINKMYARSCQGLADYISGRYTDIAEIGIGHMPDIAYALLETGISVFATDVRPFQYDGLPVVLDDITEPDFSLYESVDLIYSLRPPPELVPYMIRLAKAVGADLIVKPLSSDFVGGKMAHNGNTAFFNWGYYEKDKREKKSYYR